MFNLTSPVLWVFIEFLPEVMLNVEVLEFDPSDFLLNIENIKAKELMQTPIIG